jgi:hypothetical protein
VTPCLRPDEFIDVLDGTADAASAAHVANCARCQATLAEVRLALAAVAEVAVPEPSPLFWSQVNARVRGALDEDARRDGALDWWTWLRWDVVVPVAGIAMIVMALTSAVGRVLPASSAARPGATPDPQVEAVVTAGEPTDGDGALELMLDLAATLPDSEWDTFGMAPLPDLGVAAQSLSPDEQHALAALLQAAVDRPQS